MPVYITSRTFTDEFTGSGGGGVKYLNGVISDRMIATIAFYVKWFTTDVLLTFDGATKTITRSNNLEFGSFITDGFKVGDSFDVNGSGSNNSSFTITEITDRVITVSETISDETTAAATLFGTTPITAIDYYYNLCENNTAQFFNLSDRETKPRFSVDGITATGSSSHNMFVSTNSKAWVNGTANISEIGIVEYAQKFEIIHTFDINPVWLAEQQSNFENGLPPASSYYQDRFALKHIFQIDLFWSYQPTVSDLECFAYLLQ